MAESIVLAARAAAGLLGLPAALEAPAGVGELAERLGVGARRLGWLLDLLAADGALARQGDRYRLEPPFNAGKAPGARLVAAVLRRDAPLTTLETVGSVDATALTCHSWLERVPPELVERIAVLARDGTFLDAGCGDGAIAAAVLARDAALRVALVDRDLGRARRLLSHRVTGTQGDLTAVSLPPANVALLSYTLHMLTAEVAALVVRRVADALEAGGTLIIREVALAEDRSGPLLALAFGLSLTLFGEGDLPTPSRLTSWLEAAGLIVTSMTFSADSVCLSATKRRAPVPTPYDD